MNSTNFQFKKPLKFSFCIFPLQTTVVDRRKKNSQKSNETDETDETFETPLYNFRLLLLAL